MVAAPQLGFCGTESLRCTFPAHHPLPNGTRSRLRRRNHRVFAVATGPKPTPTGSSVNGSSPPQKSVNGASSRIGDVSQEIKRVRAQMEENEQLSILMKGLRGQNLRDSQFAADNVQLRLVEVDESSEFLPLVYDPASISAYWGKRPRAVATRIVQLVSVTGGFLSRLALDVINKKVKETSTTFDRVPLRTTALAEPGRTTHRDPLPPLNRNEFEVVIVVFWFFAPIIITMLLLPVPNTIKPADYFSCYGC